MTLRNYINGLQQFALENPDALDMQVITSKDAEGNGYEPVYYGPTKGNFNDDYEFVAVNQFEDWEMEDAECNAVCVN